MIVALALAAAGPLAACSDAVHNDPPAARAACAVPDARGSLWGDGPSPACIEALRFGRSTATVPSGLRADAVRKFDDRAARCEAGPGVQKGRSNRAQRLWGNE